MPEPTAHLHAITRPTLAILAGSTAALLGTLVLRVLLARAMSPDQLGVLFLAIAIVSSAGGVASLGVNSAVAQRLAALAARGETAAMHASARTATALAAAAGALVGGGLLLAAWLGLPHSTGAPPLADVLVPLVPVAFGLAVGLATVGVSRGFEDTGGRALIRDAGGGALRLGAVALAVATGGTVQAIAFAYAAGTLLAELSYTGYGAIKGWLGRLRWTGRDRLLLRGLPPFALMEALNQLTQWMDVVVLGALAPARAVGFYTVARGLTRALQMVHLAAAHSFLPAATAAAEGAGGAEYLRVYTRTRMLVFALFWPLLAPCLLAPATVVTLLYGGGYAPAGPILRLLALAFVAEAAFGYKDLALLALGRAREVSRVSLVATALGLLLVVALSPRQEGSGVALALLVMAASRGAALAWLLRRARPITLRHDAPPAVLAAVGATLAGAVAAAVMALPAPVELVLVTGVAGLGALLVLARLRATR